MPLSAVQTFSDPDEYAAAIRAANTEFAVTDVTSGSACRGARRVRAMRRSSR